MAKFSLPYVALREQADGTIRPRFQPGPRERAAGWKGRDLKHPGGRWYTLDEARGFALERAREIADQRASGKRLKAPPAPRGRTVADLLEAWLASPDVARKAAVTRNWYRKLVLAIRIRPGGGREQTPEPFASAPVAAIGPPEIRAFFDYLVGARGHHTAVACIAALSGAYAFARLSPDWRLKDNPAHKLKLPKPAPRVVIWSRDEVAAFVAAADALGRPSLGDSILLGLYTGQRQNDRLAMIDEGLADGRRRFRQSKTGAIVDVRETPRLAARLAEARARVAALTLARGLRERPATVLVNEAMGAAWNKHSYSHAFDAVRAAAAAGIVDETATRAAGSANASSSEVRDALAAGRNEPVWIVPPCPSLAGRRDQDLRDTAVTWLARAGCTLPEIAGVTGHSLRSIHTVLRHYLAITPELADAAIAKMVAWIDREEKTG